MNKETENKICRKITNGYARQTLIQRLRKFRIEKEDITNEMIEVERAKLEGVRTLRAFKRKIKKMQEA